jgi:hypothetical protein
VSIGHQVDSSLYACRSGMGTGLTFSVVRYGLANSRFAVGVFGVGAGSKRPKLLAVALLRRAAPAAVPFDAPHLRIRHRLPHSLRVRVSHTEGRCESLSLLLSQSTQTAAPRFSGRSSRIKPDSGAGGRCPRVPPVRHAGFRKVDHWCGPCERREPLT